jgi:hypothetical protein
MTQGKRIACHAIITLSDQGVRQEGVEIAGFGDYCNLRFRNRKLVLREHSRDLRQNLLSSEVCV